MHGAGADRDSVGLEVAFAEFLKGEVGLPDDERLEEQFAFFGDRARADWPLRLGSWPVEQNSFLRS